MRWLLLDDVISIQKGVKAITASRIPDFDVTPEVFMMEMMAQTGGLLVGAEGDYRDDLIFAKIERAEFDASYRAGQKVQIEAVSDNLKPEGAWIDGVISAGARQVAKSRFLLMNVGKLNARSLQSITFHEAFMNHFNIRDKVLA